MIISVEYDDVFIEMAEEKAEELSVLKNSITGGKGNIIGFLGEFIVVACFGGVVSNTYDYDIIVNGKRVDVKTKKTTAMPQGKYLCSVAAANTHQQCDSYYFVRINPDIKTAYLLGGLPKIKFYELAFFAKKGEFDSLASDEWRFTADCYNVRVDQLKQPPYAGSDYCYTASRSY